MRKEQLNGQIVILGEEHSGRDEMNLAGNPFALLQASSKNDQLFIRYEWERQLASGKRVNASWEVQGGGRLGLPGPAEELLYLVLMQLTRESAELGEDWPETVHFSRVDVLQRMGWSRTPKFYATLRDAFARLQAVSIQADHSFWNAKAKVPYESIGFAIIDDYAIAAEPAGRKGIQHTTLPLSWFRWNKTLHSSFLAGNVRSLALDFAVSLEHPTTRRLFRLLDMMRNAQTPARREFAMGLFKLRDRLGMSNYKFPSKIKEKLAAAHDELIERKYLEQVEYSKAKDGSPLVIYRFTDGRQSSPNFSDLDGGTEINKKVDSSAIKRNHHLQNRGVETSVKPMAKASRQSNQAKVPSSNIVGEKILASTTGTDIDVRQQAMLCHQIYNSLSTEERQELRDIARRGVEPAFWDRLEVPESPMSLSLWSLIIDRYPDKVREGKSTFKK